MNTNLNPAMVDPDAAFADAPAADAWMEEDRGEVTVKKATLEELVALSELQLKAEAWFEAQEAKMKEAKERYRVLTEETIPNMVLELGLKDYKLADGSRLEIKDDVYAQPTAEQKPAMYAWLDEHGYGSIIKTEVQVPFGRGDIDEARALVQSLEEMGIEGVSLAQDVHPQTLKAFLRERIREADPELDLETFNARPVTKSVITKPKVKKTKFGPGRAGTVVNYDAAE